MLLLAGLPARAAHRIALLIGNGACEAHAPLPNPRNDADGMAAALRDVGFEVDEPVSGDASSGVVGRFDAVAGLTALGQLHDQHGVGAGGEGVEVVAGLATDHGEIGLGDAAVTGAQRALVAEVCVVCAIGLGEAFA